MSSTSLVPCFIQIPASDAERAAKFYKNVLNFTFNDERDREQMPGDHPPMKFFHFNGTDFEHHLSGGIFQFDEEFMSKHRPMGETLYFWADDMEDISARIPENGGSILYERKHVQHGWITGFRDSEGNAHGLYTTNEAKK